MILKQKMRSQGQESALKIAWDRNVLFYSQNHKWQASGSLQVLYYQDHSYNNKLTMEFMWFYLPNFYQPPQQSPIGIANVQPADSLNQQAQQQGHRAQMPQSLQSPLRAEPLLILTREDLMNAGNAPAMNLWTQEEDRLLLHYRDQREMQWAQISEKIRGRNAKMCYNRYKRLLFSTKAHWRQKDDQKLIQLVEQHGQDWQHIGSFLRKWRPSQIRDHYLNHIRPDLSQEEWTVDEDMRLIECLNTNGRNWGKLEKHFPGRSLCQIKNRFKGRLSRLNQKKIAQMAQYNE